MQTTLRCSIGSLSLCHSRFEIFDKNIGAETNFIADDLVVQRNRDAAETFHVEVSLKHFDIMLRQRFEFLKT